LRNPADAPALFFAPFVSSTMRAEAHWIDYNGHLNAAYYNVWPAPGSVDTRLS